MDKIKIAIDVSSAIADLNKTVSDAINSSKKNNSESVESIDLEDVSSDAEVNQTDISSNQVNVSDIANSYNIDKTDLETYETSLEKELEFYQIMLEDTENELGILKEDAFEESGTNLSVIEDMCKEYEDNITSEIYQLIEQYKISCPEEKLEKFGLNQADLTSMSYAELFEILKEKDDDVKEKLESVEEYRKENLDKAISENTEFSTYDEYLKRIAELEAQQVTLNSAIYKTEQLKKMAKYEFLVKEEDYQDFNYECQIDKSVIEEMRMQMGTQVSYSEYCSKTGDNISPLEFCLWVQDNYPDTTATAMDNEALLKTLISVADKDSDMLKTYNYLFEKEGIESASKYLEDIEDQINQLAGQKKAEEFLATLEKDENGNYNYEDIMNHLKVTGKGLGDGAQSFFLGLAAWHQSSDVYSVEEYESLYILEALSGDQDFANFLDNNYEISMSIGNMLPSVAAGMLLTPAAGTFLMGASAGGNSYHQALVNGASVRDAVFYGVLSGTSEATLEKYLGAIPGLSDIKVSSLKDLGKSVLKEGTEEWTQEYVDAALRGTVLGEQIEGDQLNADALKSFIYGSIIGGIMNSPSAISGEVSNRTGSSNIENNITSETINEDINNLTSKIGDSISGIDFSTIQDNVNKSVSESISAAITNINFSSIAAIEKISNGISEMYKITEKLYDGSEITEKLYNISEATKKLYVNNRIRPIQYDKDSALNILSSFDKTNKMLNDLYFASRELDITSDSFFRTIDWYQNRDVIREYENILSINELVLDGELALDKIQQANLNRLVYNSSYPDYIEKLCYRYLKVNNGQYDFDYVKNRLCGFSKLKVKKLIETLKQYPYVVMNNNFTMDEMRVASSLYTLFDAGNFPVGNNLLVNLERLSSIYFNDILNNKKKSFHNFDKYGVDQNNLFNLSYYSDYNNGISQYQYVLEGVKNIIRSYFPNLSNAEIVKYMQGVNSTGACSYASVLNNIIRLFDNNETIFREIFGYDIYRIVDGKKYINDQYMLADLYTFSNYHNKSIFEKDFFGNYHYKAKNHEDQTYLSRAYYGVDVDLLNQFIKYKISNCEKKILKWKLKKFNIGSNVLFYTSLDRDTNFSQDILKNIVINELEKGHALDLGVYVDFLKNKNFTMYQLNYSTGRYDIPFNSSAWRGSNLEGGLSNAKTSTGHAMAITGIKNDGLIVSSWGKEYYIPFSELKNVSITLSSMNLDFN